MMRRFFTNSALALCLTVVFGATSANADDAAASVANGGIQLRRELRISMERERLTISEKKITVEFEFLNETDRDITTEVAFPVPEFGVFDSECGPRTTFSDLRIWIEGRELQYETQDQAIVNGADKSELLRASHVDIGSFGHYWGPPGKCDQSEDQVEQLSGESRLRLVHEGLLDKDRVPQWKVRRLYHWTQTFPSRKILHVRHEYQPALGYQYYSLPDLAPVTLDGALKKAQDSAQNDPKGDGRWQLAMVRPYANACIDSSLRKRLATTRQTPANNGTSPVEPLLLTEWVDYILTSANTWKTPIKEFELVVEKPSGVKGSNWYASFCWEGPVKKLDENHFSATATDFVPKKELTILFLANYRD